MKYTFHDAFLARGWFLSSLELGDLLAPNIFVNGGKADTGARFGAIGRRALFLLAKTIEFRLANLATGNVVSEP